MIRVVLGEKKKGKYGDKYYVHSLQWKRMRENWKKRKTDLINELESEILTDFNWRNYLILTNHVNDYIFPSLFSSSIYIHIHINISLLHVHYTLVEFVPNVYIQETLKRKASNSWSTSRIRGEGEWTIRSLTFSIIIISFSTTLFFTFSLKYLIFNEIVE